MKPMTFIPQVMPGRRPSSGFTLIEVMIAAAIGMVMLFATLSVFDSTDTAKARLRRTNEIFQTGVFALNTLQSDIKLAGFYGEGDVTAAQPASTPDPCATTATAWRDAMPIPVQTYRADQGGRPSCVSSSLVADSSVITIRRAATCTVGTSNCSSGSSGTPMVQVSQCATDASRFMTGTTQGSLTLHGVDCTSTAPMRQYITRIYYLDQNNVSGDGIPTLKRMDLDSTGFTSVTVAQGVQQMRLVYGVDNVGANGIADTWTSAPAAADMFNIVEVKINLLMKSIESDPTYVNSKSYQVGDLTIAAANDNYHRNMVSVDVRIPNTTGPRGN